MYNSMPPTNTRKRPAPGASPTPQLTQTYPATSQMSNSEYRWNQGAENMGYADPAAAYNMNAYNGNNIAQPPAFEQQNSSTQLARRPVNQHLMQTAQRYDNPESWGQFDDSMLDPQGANGAAEENDSVELLEERAAVAKRDAQSKRKQIPPFVQKLSRHAVPSILCLLLLTSTSFLDESKNTELIRWSDRGDSFVVLDEDEFAKTLIPELFKHNNYASFVRQLNMYGFHKRVGLSDNSMKASERKNKSPSEYYNPYFRRGHPNLLWLINKPKGGTAKTKAKGRAKNEENQGDSEDEGEGVEEVYSNTVLPPQRAISQAPESGLQRALQNQLMEIQKQQGAITNAISRLRKDHNQLYQQSMAFQTLHDRHENSINAILTFLATVYNRSLDGQGPQNIAQMFAAGIPQDQQGNVVDVTGQQESNPGSHSPHRRQPRLLMAPPSQGGRISTASPSASNTPRTQDYQPSGSIEELFDSPADTTEPTTNSQQRPQNMMNIIHNTNAHHRASSASHTIQFPDMLSHYENTHGTTLTPEQRLNMLNDMNMLNNTTASQNGTASTNNALASPTPPLPLNLEDLEFTQQQIDDLVKLQNDQEQRISHIAKEVEPLSPSGSIPGLTTDVPATGYFGAHDFGHPDAGLDIDQYLDDGAFFGGSPGHHVDFGTPGFEVGGVGSGGDVFDELGLNDTVGQNGNGSGSREPSPEEQNRLGLLKEGVKSPTKRRRKN